MITINQGMTNSVVLRFSDNLTIANPIYVFEFQSLQSKELTYFTATDESLTSRYNQFTIYEIGGTTQSLALTASIPQIQLTYGGYYNYRVFESNNYVLGTHSVVLDEGKMLFQNGEYETFFFDLNESSIWAVFDDFGTAPVAFVDGDINLTKVFDPEFVSITKYIITHNNEIITTQDGYHLTYK